MRLTPEEIATIRRLVAEIYGPGAVVRLFGSQLDDSKKGGDVDLLVEIDEDELDLGREIGLKIALEEALGERKVDLIVHRHGRRETPFVRIAKSEGIIL